ncbi:DUF7619 domain-containing protein [Kordia jejudonensis]|uniref:DUF7619 domain-containing protein n=1 Tax=Kordia jejudonensis TaxID=1348245 RepID=UPI00062916B9|nr:T9SS type A sorting domain-containing protein [Kordia jejudonensis]
MKKSYLLLSLFFFIQWSQAQIVNIPDAIFKNELINMNSVDIDGDGTFDTDADTNDDGEIQVSEALAVTSLSVTGNNLYKISDLTGIESFTNLTYLNIAYNELTSVNLSQNTSLTSLDCKENLLTSLNVTLNTALESLDCKFNNISTLDVTQNAALHTLKVRANELTSLDISQNPLLYELDCFDNMLTALDLSQNPALYELDCGSNLFTSLDFSQNTALYKLSFDGDVLTNVNLSQNTALYFLSFSGPMLSQIDLSQNTALHTLAISNTMITNLDLRPNVNLNFFNCITTPLATIDLSQSNYLRRIYMTDTALTSLDISATRIRDLYCLNNPNLTYINAKNGISSYADIDLFDVTFNLSGNPQLEYICADEGLETRSFRRLVSAQVNSYCSFVPGGNFITVEGSSILDINADGCDVSDPVFPNLNLLVTNWYTDIAVMGGTNGDYAAYIQGGTQTITPQLENPTYFTVSPTSLTIDTSTATNPTLQDFCITPNGTHNDVEVIIIPLEIARPGFDALYQITYKNKGTTTRSGTVQLTFDDGVMDFVSASPMEDSQAVNTLTWNYTNLAPLESRNITFTMNINTPTDVPAVNGDDILSYEVMVTPTADDETPDDNVMTLAQTVVNSFDPNDIRCLEGETVTTDYIGKYVHYIVRFENTGTASAVNIVVSDYIDDQMFNITTLIPIVSSHRMETRVREDNVVEFIFENINLPFNDASNDGYLVFKIKTLPTLQENDTFDNKANIYFDFNAPIITNTATTLIMNPLSISEENLATENITIYPNPASEQVQIISKDALEQIELRAIDGRLITAKSIRTTSFSNTLDVSFLPKGIYLMNITTAKSKTTKKIVKQ